ncbi:MAG: hypothetical protein V9G19_16650 [Tetrasphaera sp.]
MYPPLRVFGAIRPRATGRGAALVSTAAIGVSSMVACTGSATPSTTSATSVADEAQEKAAVLADMKKSLSGLYQLDDPPEVTPVRWVLPEERQDLIDSCLAGEGFEKDSGGAINTAGRMEQYNLANYVCNMKYPPVPRYSKTWERTQKSAQYAWTRDYIIPCLSAHGYSLQKPLPSEAAFVDSWDTAAYRPFAELDERYEELKLDNSIWNRLERECAQTAPSAVLWDGVSVAEWKETHPIRPASNPS